MTDRQREQFEWLAEEYPNRTGEELYNLALRYYLGAIKPEDPDFELAIAMYRYEKLHSSFRMLQRSHEYRTSLLPEGWNKRNDRQN